MLRSWLCMTLALVLCAGCSKKPIEVGDLTKFADQGPGAASPEELVDMVKNAAARRDMAALQQLVFAKGMTDDNRLTLNAQFLSLVSSGVKSVDYLDDLAILKSPAMADLAWYVYDPAKHAKLIEASQAALEKSIAQANAESTPDGAAKNTPAKQSDSESAVEAINEPIQPENPGQPNVKPVGALIVRLPDLGKAPIANQLVYLVGKAPKANSLYLGLILPPPEEPTASPTP